MTTKEIVTNEVLDSLSKKQHDVLQKVMDGTLDPRQVLRALQDIENGRFGRCFQIWKTIKLGTGLKTADNFYRAIIRVGCCACGWTRAIFDQPDFTVADEEIELDLVRVMVAELGFKDRATREQIYQRGKELGLGLCPAEVGPQLRIEYSDQVKDEWLHIAMEPITDKHGGLNLFSIVHNNLGSSLHCCHDEPKRVWRGDRVWVWVRNE